MSARIPRRPTPSRSGRPRAAILEATPTPPSSFLRQITDINTTVRNVENVNRLGKIISRRLAHLGFAEHPHRQFDIGDISYYANHDSQDNDVLLLCHLDTPYSARDFVPFREERGRLLGTGLTECKGGMAVMLSALQALRFTRKLRKIRCGILITTDDSLGGRYSKGLVEEYARRSRYVLGMKWGETDGGIITSGYGRDDYKIEVSGTRHASDPQDLIPDICRRIISLSRLSRDDSRIRVSSVRAHTSYGGAPDYASISIVTNFATKALGNATERQVRQILGKKGAARMDIEMLKENRREPIIETEWTRKLYGIVEEQAGTIDVPVRMAERLISSDISHVPDGIPALDGMGPLGAGYRSPSEYIVKTSLIDRALLLALTLHRCASAPGEPEK